MGALQAWWPDYSWPAPGPQVGTVAGVRLPWLSERTDDLRGWDVVRLLSVSLDRVRRWYAPGLLVIGDAAHAMSPAGGVGINLAVQDAVAASRIIGDRLRSGRVVDTQTLRAVQRRRWWPTALVQFGQRMAHRVLSRAVQPEAQGPQRMPRAAGHGVARRRPSPSRMLPSG